MIVRSIREKLVTVVMLTTLAALLVSIGTVIAYDLRNYHKALLGDMATQAELLGHMTSAALAFDDARLATENLALLRIRPSVRAGAIYDAKGALFASYRAPGELHPFPVSPQTDDLRVSGDDLLLYRRVVENGELLGTVYLRAEYTLVARAVDYLSIAAGVIALAMLIAWLMTRRLGRIVTAPIVALTETAREVVSTRDYSRRAPRISDDEAGELVDSFNAMLGEIEQRTGALETSHHAIAREAEERARAQQEIMDLNEQLEVRVHERTMQLELTNAELEVAMAAAKNANQAKSAFLSSMSHELRTPLNAILGFAQILTSESLPSTLPQKKEFAGHILKSGRHLLTLINEILDLAKVESGTVTLSMEPVALADMLVECRNMTEPLAQQRKIRMLFPDAPGAVVQADRTRLKQVLLNLLSNAIKYNREMGAVVCDCSVVTANRVRLSVQDTGMGLRPEQISSLFQPFNRLGQENGSEEGTGIGLVVTRRLVELMGGEIGVSSSVGVGTVFWIELGLTQPVPSAVGEAVVLTLEHKPAPVPLADHSLLYVEDNPANLKLVQEIVRFRPDLHLLTAPDGHLGIELAKAHLPDVILMDINLPCVSGLDALKELRSDPRTAHIPVIALTANAMPRDVERGLASGFFRYLTKPINIDEFNEAIDSTLAFADTRQLAQKARNP
ncbi:hybrid sensor histidine kinase/response regulator [Massilia violaceinigra]|uniref:histidine kinase n=1 Tax=Massilia violaceinigra TaxID=2045208 RepID=A0A2D2DJ91_9BURK|nr:ATP-binding protein [Massilia violaceinigra]ATQ75041.1 hybrid sensor histidine kinase/response regulator [Massilia violaceinigra]